MPLTTAPPVFAEARDGLYLAPALLLAGWGLLVLVADFALLRRSSSARRRVALGTLSLVGAAGAASLGLSAIAGALGIDALHDDYLLFFGSFAGDPATVWLGLVLSLLLAMVVGLAMTWDFTEHWGELYALMLWAGSCMMLLVAAEELLTIFLTLETMTICLYLLTALEKRRRRSAEGGLKYFVYGSVSSALFLFGLSLIYGLTGTTRLDAIGRALGADPVGPGLEGQLVGAMAVLLVLVGFGFKLAAVPFHQWAPDAYEGAPAPVAALIASGSKLASVVALLKVLILGLGPWAADPNRVTTPGWVGLLALIAAASMTCGNLAALAQRNLKRMLAYSSIAHAGYILVGVLAVAVSQSNQDAAGGMLFYLVTYAFAVVGAFALAAWLARDFGSDEIDDLAGLAPRAPMVALGVVVLMLGLIGLPPTAGFIGKLAMFKEALNTRQSGAIPLAWLVGLALMNSVVSAFYYVRVLRAMYLRSATKPLPAGPPRAVAWTIGLSALITLGLGLAPSTLLDPLHVAATPMLSAGPDPRHRVAPQGDPTDRQAEFLSRGQEEDDESFRRTGIEPRIGTGGP